MFEGRDEIKVGLVGCGGRGTGAALQALRADKGAVLVAMADAFSDRLEHSLANLQKEAPGQIRLADDHKFIGLDSGERLIASGVDVVLLASPPVFRPAHLRAAIEAGKHVFCEKPVAVDAPGVRSVLETGAPRPGEEALDRQRLLLAVQPAASRELPAAPRRRDRQDRRGVFDLQHRLRSTRTRGSPAGATSSSRSATGSTSRGSAATTSPNRPSTASTRCSGR